MFETVSNFQNSGKNNNSHIWRFWGQKYTTEKVLFLKWQKIDVERADSSLQNLPFENRMFQFVTHNYEKISMVSKLWTFLHKRIC